MNKLQEKEFKVNGEDQLAWNIVEGSVFQEIIEKVFDRIAERVGFTMGPFGNKTLMDNNSSILMTKDGFNVIKNISYNNRIYNSVAHLLQNAAATIVSTVGDGSSTCIVSANKLYKRIRSNEKLKELRAKDLQDTIESAVNMITNEIIQRANKIDENGDLQEIWDIAYVSTDSNAYFASIILDIYRSTKNPSIEYVEGKGLETTYDIIDGFMGYTTYLDRIYMTSDDENCVIENPLIMMFNYKINADDYKTYIQPALEKAITENKRLVVISPYYDTLLLESIRKQATMEFNSRGTTSVVYCRAPISNSDMNENYNDFAMMAGCEIISESMVTDFAEQYKWENGKVVETIPPTRSSIETLGFVEKITIGPDKTVISGFNNRSEETYKIYLDDAEAKYNKALEDSRASGIVTHVLSSTKKRLSRLRGKIGLIKVGGKNIMERGANYDAVEDAVKACESAYIYGYNIGGSLIIPIIVKDIINDTDDIYEKTVLELIGFAMNDVYKEVLKKYYDKEEDAEKIDEIIKTSVAEGRVFDLITKDFSDNIINPCRTDIEVLRTTASLIAVLLSSNQYLTVIPEEDIY